MRSREEEIRQRYEPGKGINNMGIISVMDGF
jgi:hypothetical protein